VQFGCECESCEANQQTLIISCAFLARDKCFQACIQSFTIALIVILVMEAYQRLPPDTSTLPFVAHLLVRTGLPVRRCVVSDNHVMMNSNPHIRLHFCRVVTAVMLVQKSRQCRVAGPWRGFRNIVLERSFHGLIPSRFFATPNA